MQKIQLGLHPQKEGTFNNYRKWLSTEDSNVNSIYIIVHLEYYGDKGAVYHVYWRYQCSEMTVNYQLMLMRCLLKIAMTTTLLYELFLIEKREDSSVSKMCEMFLSADDSDIYNEEMFWRC